MDTRLALMCGTDIPIPECGLIAHQPRIQEIAYVGEDDFFIGIQTFTITKKRLEVLQDESLLANTNNFQIFMTIMSEKEAADKKLAVQQILPLFFPKYKVLFTPRSLIFSGENGQQVMIDENNFDSLQEVITKICCLKTGPNSQDTFNPGNEKAKEIAAKLMKGRQRVAEINGTEHVSIFSQYLSILTVGLNSMSLVDCMNLTMFQLYDLIERYSLYINWDMDIRQRLAGGKPDGKPDNWMKNIH